MLQTQARIENVKNMTNFEFSSWSEHLEISDFRHLSGNFLPSNGSKTFYALFDHDVGMKSNLQVQNYLTHVESSLCDAHSSHLLKEFTWRVWKFTIIFINWERCYCLPQFDIIYEASNRKLCWKTDNVLDNEKFLSQLNEPYWTG